MSEYEKVMKMIKSYVRNQRFIRRYKDELLLIDTKYFNMRSSSVIGTPNGLQNASVHVNASLGQEKLDELKMKHGKRYDTAVEHNDRVDGLLSRLPNDIKEMVIHCYINKRYVDELADRYKCTRATIYNRMNAAIKNDCDLLN